MDSAEFRAEFARNPSLQRVLYRYTDTLLAQAIQIAVCSRFHVLEARLARSLLITRDRLQSDKFHLTHEFLAHALGVRRVGVTKAASALQQQGLIIYSRGNIEILDVPGLAAASCKCYEIVKDAGEEALVDARSFRACAGSFRVGSRRMAMRARDPALRTRARRRLTHQKKCPALAGHFSCSVQADHFGGLTWLPITPPTAAPPTVPTVLPPVSTPPITAPAPAPIAVFLSCCRHAGATAQAEGDGNQCCACCEVFNGFHRGCSFTLVLFQADVVLDRLHALDTARDRRCGGNAVCRLTRSRSAVLRL